MSISCMKKPVGFTQHSIVTEDEFRWNQTRCARVSVNRPVTGYQPGQTGIHRTRGQSMRFNQWCDRMRILSSPVIQVMMKNEYFIFFIDKAVLAYALYYMRQTSTCQSQVPSCYNDGQFFAFLSLAIDMLEDMSGDIFNLALDSYFLARNYVSLDEAVKIEFRQKIRSYKTQILQQLDWNACVPQKAFVECEQIVKSLLTEMRCKDIRNERQYYLKNVLEEWFAIVTLKKEKVERTLWERKLLEQREPFTLPSINHHPLQSYDTVHGRRCRY